MEFLLGLQQEVGSKGQSSPAAAHGGATWTAAAVPAASGSLQTAIAGFLLSPALTRGPV